MSMFKRKDPAALQAQLAAMKGGSSFNDSDKNEWKLKTDEAGNGSAVIRFLPAKTDEQSSPFIKMVNHGFKKNGKWYIENCSSTHGDFDSCPVCQHLSRNDSFNTNQDEYKLLKRKTSYWSNILILKDPKAPENEGKVMKFRFGQKIMDKINAMVEVDVSIGEIPVDVTCPFDGANFVMKVKKVSGFQNYDECKFSGQSEIQGINDEAKQKLIEDGSEDLSTINAKDKFKPYDELETKFKQVLGTAAMGTAASRASDKADAIGDSLDNFDKEMADFGSSSSTSGTSEPASTSSSDSEIDDLLAGL